ncbi:hypothetical protein C4D60_Mb11t22430 [Musa balbisiana]|uniref:Uncharacterized protein n=1 Tax=Musa balbisiana TaxID=52838 RepID=A0A4S8J7N5_MUSBA|nr:hypothetical protein C4D60_Mb11t22430 [Musa balbisiana]
MSLFSFFLDDAHIFSIAVTLSGRLETQYRGEWLMPMETGMQSMGGCRRLIPSRNARRGFEEQITGVSISRGITILESVDSNKYGSERDEVWHEIQRFREVK